MEGSTRIKSHVGSNHATGSDQVEAPVASADPNGCGRGQFQTVIGDGPQAAIATGKSGNSQAAISPGSEPMELGFSRITKLQRTPPNTRRALVLLDRPAIRE